MKLSLQGHDYKYAVEQIMLTLFPDERPEYSDDPGGLTAQSKLTLGRVYAQAATVIQKPGLPIGRGIARVRRDRLTEPLETDRLLQRAVKQSFYKAAAGFIETPPEWGSLTGIRPAKIAEGLLAQKSEKATRSYLTREYFVSPERAKLCVETAKASLAVQRTLTERDIALYVGIPFCPTRCAYCSFVSNSVEKSFGLIEPFVKALLCEIAEMAELVREQELRVIAVYIGGGTPTALPPDALDKVLGALREAFDLSAVCEYTVEAGRPDTITEQKLETMLRHGVTRTSVNPQSFSPKVLAAIGREHMPEDALEAVELVQRVGAGALSLNMDVIAGLPGDTPEGFRQTLDTVLSLRPENVTVHTLSLKKGSKIMLEDMRIPSGEAVSDMLRYAYGRLRQCGCGPYYMYRQKFTSGGFENTGWSIPGHEGIYNICMMQELCSVLALGGGGVTKLVLPNGRIERVFNPKYPREYIMRQEQEQGPSGIDKVRKILTGEEPCHLI